MTCVDCSKSFKIPEKYPDTTQCFPCRMTTCEGCEKWIKRGKWTSCYDCHTKNFKVCPSCDKKNIKGDFKLCYYCNLNNKQFNLFVN